MKCLTNKKIIGYLDKTLNSVEFSMARDHILICKKCSESLQSFTILESCLSEPVFTEAPTEIETIVKKKLFHGFSHIASLISLISASFLLLVAGIYIYFNFANDSMVRAFQMTTDRATSIISSAVKFVSVVFSGLLTIFKAVNTLLEVLLHVEIGVELTGIVFAFILIMISYFLYNRLFGKTKDARQVND